MDIIEAHEKRITDIDEEIQRIDAEIHQLGAARRGNPTGGAAEAARHARSRRQAMEDERDDLLGDLTAIHALETSQARKAQRLHARKTMQAALDTREHRRQLVAALEQAGELFLRALDEVITLGNATQAAVRESAELATPFHTHLLGDPWHNGLLRQRQLLIETTYPHASGVEGPDMQHALAHFVMKVAMRSGNPSNIAIPAAGWVFDHETLTPGSFDLLFQQAAERAHGRLEHNSSRIELCLKEPHELAEIAGGKHG
jgi:hypothetical protein